MDSEQKKIVLGVLAFVLFAWLISPFFFSTREPDRVPRVIPLSFEASRACETAIEFTNRFPNRDFGSLESRQSTGYIHDRLAELGYKVSYTHFDARIAGRQQVGRNVMAFKQGQNTDIVVAVAHFDTARTTVRNAANDGSGVGVLLELARVFAGSQTRRSFLFLFSDGGEWGGIGARDIAENFPDRDRVVVALSLDYVVAGDLASFCLEETGQFKGFTPPWLRQLARGAAEAQGLSVIEASGLQEHFERALLISTNDQGPFLRAGIPAINLGSISADRPDESVEDGVDTQALKVSAQSLKIGSFEKYGNAAEHLLRALDALPSIPSQSPGSFRLWGTRYLIPVLIPILHLIAFLPLAFIFGFHISNHRRRLNAIGVGRELLVSLATALPLLLIFFSISLARALRKIPLYSFYPPTAKDPVLANPPWNVLGIILGAALLTAAVCYIIGRFSVRDLPKPDYYASKLTLLAMMLVVVALAFLHNSYWAIAFLLLPSWIWALVGFSRTRTGQVINGILILLAGTPYYAALGIYAGRLDIGWNFIWYQVLAYSSGLFATSSCLLGAAAVVLGIRFLAIQFRGSAS